MINRSIFKAYDIRGIYPADINEESVSTVGKACVRMFKEGTFIIAHDARHGSTELIKILERSIDAEAAAKNKSVKVINAGFTTTPMFYFLVNHFKASGGAMITASHNPKEYNGLKVVREGAETVSGTDILSFIDSHFTLN